MEIKRIDLSSITPADYNPRRQLTPDDAQYQKLAASIETFGYVEPIIWNRRTGNLVGGHQRLNILTGSGHTQAEAVIVDMSLHDEKILNVLLNRAKGRWDNEKLADLLNELNEAGAMACTGFDEWELQGLLDDYDGKLEDILSYAPKDSEESRPPEEADTFDMTFSIPIEEQPAVNAYLEAEELPLERLAEVVVRLAEGLTDNEN